MKTNMLIATLAKIAATQANAAGTSIASSVINHYQTKIYALFNGGFNIINDDNLSKLRRELSELERNAAPALVKRRKRQEIDAYIKSKQTEIYNFYSKEDVENEEPLSIQARATFDIVKWPDAETIGSIKGSSYERNNVSAMPLSEFKQVHVDVDTMLAAEEGLVDFIAYSNLTDKQKETTKKKLVGSMDVDNEELMNQLYIIDCKQIGFDLTLPRKNAYGKYYAYPELHIVLESFADRYKFTKSVADYSDALDSFMNRNNDIIGRKGMK